MKLSPWQVPQQEEGARLRPGLGTHTDPHRLVGFFKKHLFLQCSLLLLPSCGQLEDEELSVKHEIGFPCLPNILWIFMIPGIE